ncbi:hypothetical protein ACHAXA_006547 [Cyclostephanos tholiformis]|uniref:Uncharacterized protein n=1 Tax=Cyclostephanos tholiformis TaxID=382380 RepID=A0ABD3RD82_9STRA
MKSNNNNKGHRSRHRPPTMSGGGGGGEEEERASSSSSAAMDARRTRLRLPPRGGAIIGRTTMLRGGRSRVDVGVGGVGPPGRLGWLGDGMMTNDIANGSEDIKTTNDDDDDDDDDYDVVAAMIGIVGEYPRVDDDRGDDIAKPPGDGGDDDENDAPLAAVANPVVDLTLGDDDDDDDDDGSTSKSGKQRERPSSMSSSSSSSSSASTTKTKTTTTTRTTTRVRHHDQSSSTTDTDDAVGRWRRMKPSSRVVGRSSRTKNGKIATVTATADATTAIASSSMMWIDKYAPRDSRDLCVATKKVDEVRDFLNSHVRYNRLRMAAAAAAVPSSCYSRDHRSKRRRRRSLHDCDGPSSTRSASDEDENENDENYDNDDDDAVAALSSLSNTPPISKLMILTGAPGIGKSATVRALACELNIDVVSWDDSQVEYNTNNDRDNADHYRQSDGIIFGGGGTLPYQSRLDSFDAFLIQGGAGMTSLDMLVGGGGGDGDDDDGDGGDEGGDMGGVERRMVEEETEGWGGGGSGMTRYDDAGGQDGRSRGKDGGEKTTLILVEEIPNLYNPEAEALFR